MRNIATIPARDREALFRNTAAKMGMSEAIIEKDFWVCYMLIPILAAVFLNNASRSRAGIVAIFLILFLRKYPL